jgi:SAM-dependent methyltransferase
MAEPSYLRETRAGYDVLAPYLAERWADELGAKPLDRAMLAAFAENVLASGGGPVGDLGCGQGRVASHLHSLGVDVFGIDLSPTMVRLARETYPGLRFEEGRLAALGLKDESLAGALAWFSIIHTPPEDLPEVFAEFHRVLAPGGHLLIAFQIGDGPRHYSEAFGHRVSLDFHRLRPERITELLAAAGLTVTARLVREPSGEEKVPQAYLLGHKA